MNAPDARRRLALPRKTARSAKPRRSKAFVAELRRQCRRANEADRRDAWKRFVYLPE
ncbi:MAG: hypothetical protein ACREVC_17685 [Burkholderiales bacterium]